MEETSEDDNEIIETPVAIKRFKSIESDTLYRDFLREAKIMKKLKHENIVKIYEFYENPLLIIMEYMSGGSLLTYLSIHRPDLKFNDLLHFALDIAKVCIVDTFFNLFF
jgi:serine/threonine protein kinase